MDKQNATPAPAASSAPAKPVPAAKSKIAAVFDPEAKYGPVFENPQKPKARLPRFGCFWIYFIFLFFAMALATGYYHSVGEVATTFETPEGAVTVSDPEGVLLEDDQTKLESLAGEIAKLADCSVALMFIDERFAGPKDVFDQIAADWAPGKGVLLVQDVRGTSVRFGLIGGGWRLADWDIDAVRKEAGKYRGQERGAKAAALLERLKHSIQTAAKLPATAENADPQASRQPGASVPAKNPANMTDEELEKLMDAEDKAAEAALDAELDDEDFEDDEETVGMRAYAEKNKGGNSGGILYSSITGRGGEGSPMRYTIVFLGICALVAVISLKNGKSQRARDLKKGPETLAAYKKKYATNKRLLLTDTNEFDDKKWYRNKYLRIIAIVLGILQGIAFVSSTLNEPVEKDVPRPENSLIPAAPLDGWRIVDKAAVFGEDGTAKLAAAIGHLEAQTGGEMMVLTVPTIGMASIEDFGLETASKWKIGKAGEDNGALLVLAINDHRSRLEIGYGWEGAVNDARAGDILREIVPELQAEQYAEAAIKAVQKVEFFVTGVRQESVTVESGRPQTTAPQTAYVPQVREYPAIAYTQPGHDPRILNASDSLWGAIGVFGCLFAVLLAYWGRIVGTSVPHLVIVDPTAVHYSSSSGGGSSSSSRSSGSSRSYSSSSHSSGGGGGSFGGGGASGRW